MPDHLPGCAARYASRPGGKAPVVRIPRRALLQTPTHLGGAIVLVGLATALVVSGSTAGFAVAAGVLAAGVVVASLTVTP